MDRREFIKGVTAFAALGALGSVGISCGQASENGSEKSTQNAIGLITRRPHKGGPFSTPLLGFGMMRLPEGGSGIDRKKASAMVERALAAGLNYFDTAYMYHGGESEKFIGQALASHPRESYLLTDKLPAWELNSRREMEKTFDEQLRRTRAGYFDFYFIHWLNDGNWEHAQKLGAYEFIKEKQRQGLVRRVGFSYHGGPECLDRIASAAEWDLAQVQLNFRDWDSASHTLYETLTRRGIPVSVMGPLGGGTLASISRDAEAILRKAAPEASTASWMFRFIGSLPNVQVVLSGMSTMEQLEDNIRTFTDFRPLTDEERSVLRQAAEASNWKRTGSSKCTGCRYCMPCPAGVMIPDVFRAYNRYREGGDRSRFATEYAALPAKGRADACVDCKACLSKCPQKIEIPRHLREIVAELNG